MPGRRVLPDVPSDASTDPASTPAPAPVTVRRLVGVYHAEGTLVGELRYWIGARLGRAHCALCDITHGTFRARPEWKACADALPVPFTAVRLDEREPALAAATEGHTPCVAAETGDGWFVLVGADELEACDGRPEALAQAIAEALAERRAG